MANIQEENKSISQAKLSEFNMESRYYESKYPRVGDYVKVKINKISDTGAYASLVEYNNIDGFIPVREFSSIKMKNVTKAFKEGKYDTVVVLNIDSKTGCIDLSKKEVEPEEVAKFEEKFGKAKTVNLMLRSVAEKLQMDLESVYKCTAWKLQEQFENVYDAFRVSILDPEKVWPLVTAPEDLLEALKAEIKRKLNFNEVKVRADFEMTCCTPEGINSIKYAISRGDKYHQEKPELKFQVVSAPIYVVVAYTVYPSVAIEKMAIALKDVEAALKSRGGEFKLLEAPRVVGDKGEQDIKLLLEAIEKREKEKEPDSSDDDSESD